MSPLTAEASTSTETPRSHALVLEAFEDTARSYAVARHLVFDLFPHGNVDESILEPAQREALTRLSRDEARLAGLRHPEPPCPNVLRCRT